MAKRFVPLGVQAGKGAPVAENVDRMMETREAAQAKAAAEKTAARGTDAKPAHSLYPHLD